MSTLNPIEMYHDAGRRAAKAMNVQDIALHDHERRWYRQARSLERKEDWPAVDAAYRAGWDEVRHVPKFTPFR